MRIKRQSYISAEEASFGVAAIMAMRSKDPDTQNGACIVDSRNRIISCGYNGFPRGCHDDDFSWDRKGLKPSDCKYDYVIHAEENAILNSRNIGDLEGATLYLYSEKGYYPCCKCAQAIVQSGISHVIMLVAMNAGTDVYDWESTKRMFAAAKVEITISLIGTEILLHLAEQFKEAATKIKLVEDNS